MANQHESISYGLGDMKSLYDTCVIRGIIVSVNSENNTASVHTDKYGLLLDVPIFYHCPGETDTSKGHTAFKEDADVLILAKNLRGYYGTPPSTMLRIVGFTDGLRKCGLPHKIIFRTHPYGFFAGQNSCKTNANYCHWAYYTSYDKCFVWDVETDSPDLDIKMEDYWGEHTFSPTWPQNYERLRRESDIFLNYQVGSSLPFSEYWHYSNFQSGGYVETLNEWNENDDMCCYNDMGTQEIAKNLIENGFGLSFGNGYGAYFGNTKKDNPHSVFSSLLWEGGAVEVFLSGADGHNFYNMQADEYARLIKGFDPFSPQNINEISLSEYPSNGVLLSHVKDMMSAYFAQALPASIDVLGHALQCYYMI